MDTVSDSPFGQTRRVRTRWVVGTWLYVLAYLSKEGLCGVRIGNNKDLVSLEPALRTFFTTYKQRGEMEPCVEIFQRKRNSCLFIG